MSARVLVVDDPIEMDVAARRARKDGDELPLTVREFDLLAFFMAHPGQAFTRAELMKRVQGWSFGDQSTVTVHVRRLRDKVEPDPASPGCSEPSGASATAGTRSLRLRAAGQISPTRKVGRSPAARDPGTGRRRRRQH